MTAPRIDLDELERLEREATPGPWVDMDAPHTGYDGFFYGDGETILGRTLRIEDCIPEVRNALPALLAVVRAAEAWWKMHKPVGWTEREHAQNPEVNCVGDTERALASVVAALAPFRKEKADD